jgi:hypothetical protein
MVSQTQIEIKIREIRSASIIAIPSEVITGKEFKNANIAWLKTKDGGDFEVIFDAFGNPLTDTGLMNRIGKFYNKKFQLIRFDGKPAFAQINRA